MKLTAGLTLAALLAIGGCGSDGGGGAGGSGGSSGGSQGTTGGRGGSNQGSGGSNQGSGGSGAGGSQGGSGTGGSGTGGSGTGGTGTGGSGTGGSGTGGSGTGGTGTGGAGGSGTGGTGGTPSACPTRTATPYGGALLGRCNPMSCTDGKCGQTVARGGFFTLDDFEGLPTATPPIGINWPARDARTGSWIQLAAPTTNGTLSIEATTGSAAGSKQALHYKGGPGAYGAAAGLPMGSSCYDAAAYEGISFWIKGDPSGNSKIKFSVHTPVSEPVESGGACTMNCYDHFAKVVDVTPGWTRIKIKWSDLTQTWCAKPVPAIPANWQAEKQILAFSFSQTDEKKPFDFWIDDITFDLETRPASTFAEIVTKPVFEEMFKTPKAPFTYEGLVAAIAKYGTKWGGSFGAEGMPVDRKHEAAAFLAHVAHETGSLTLAEEVCKCTMPPYYGRGAIQLTGRGNYEEAQAAGFSDIVARPERVVADADYAFGTALWFWMTNRSAKGVCHQAILRKDFAFTTNIINGGIECNADPMSKQHSRIKLFREFAAALGISVNDGLKLVCP